MQALRAHDLLWAAVESLQLEDGWRAWADCEWLRRAPLVVRRETTSADLVPVGLRGLARNQRSKGYVARVAVQRCVSPEMLSGGAHPALRDVAPPLDALGLAWGPTGGVGFFLATGLPVLRADSDLDLLVRAPVPLDAAQTRALADLQRHACWRIDIQVDTGHGGFALAEWARGGRVMLKTNDGPRLCLDPWAAS